MGPYLMLRRHTLLQVSWGTKSSLQGQLTAAAFLTGAVTSMLCGFLGMMIATYSNARTTLACANHGRLTEISRVTIARCYTLGFNTAFRGGSVMGYALCSLGVVLWALLSFFRTVYPDPDDWEILFDCAAGYGLGGSTVAMFGRVGGGIYTKAQPQMWVLTWWARRIRDRESTGVPPVVAGLDEDDPNNPATIAVPCQIDNVGDNVGDIAGMGADLFGSFAESTCAALVIAAAAVQGRLGLKALIMLPVIYLLALHLLPHEFRLEGVRLNEEHLCEAFMCATMGCVGTAVNIIQGLALGYKSCIIPVFVLSSAIFVSFQLCDLYGIALAALAKLATLACGLTIDGFGPISDNAGGIAEMALFNPEVRRRTDALDAAGNTTAAIGKGFAIGSAALVSLALYGAFVVRLRASWLEENEKIWAAFLIIGCMIPYWFAALTMKSVGKAAGEMVAEVKRQFSIKDPRVERAFGLLVALLQFTVIQNLVNLTKIKLGPSQGLSQTLNSEEPEKLVPEIYAKIMGGAIQFLKVEYAICTTFCVLFSLVIYGLVSWGTKSSLQGQLTAAAFLTGAVTSMLCGFLGMMIATYSNARTTLACANHGYTLGFNTAFRGGSVMGYALCSLGVVVLWALLTFFRTVYPDPDDWEILFDCAAGYGLGGSTVAMFGRVGGGIYTKAQSRAFSMKVVAGLDEDDPNNPATIADNVGDNVGDIAGMGADLFGSFAESTCAALVIAAAAVQGRLGLKMG
eukprot:Skav212344  [mRNA]  locus=scaffold1488:249526:272130:+ [translate_table: standard]